MICYSLEWALQRRIISRLTTVHLHSYMNKSLESMETNLVEPLSLNGEEAEVLSLREKSVNPDMTYEEITNTHTTNEEPINTNGSTVCQESNKLSSTQVSAESTPHCDQSNREAKEEEPIIDLTMKRSATVKRKHTQFGWPGLYRSTSQKKVQTQIFKGGEEEVFETTGCHAWSGLWFSVWKREEVAKS